MSQDELPENDNLDLPMEELDFTDMSEETPTSDDMDDMAATESFPSQTPEDEDGPVLADFGDIDAPDEESDSPVLAETGKKKGKKSKKSKEKSTDAEPLGERLMKTSPFVVMLGLSMIAILIALLLLFLELDSYNFDIKANAAKSLTVFVSPSPIQSAPMV